MTTKRPAKTAKSMPGSASSVGELIEQTVGKPMRKRFERQQASDIEQRQARAWRLLVASDFALMSGTEHLYFDRYTIARIFGRECALSNTAEFRDPLKAMESLYDWLLAHAPEKLPEGMR